MCLIHTMRVRKSELPTTTFCQNEVVPVIIYAHNFYLYKLKKTVWVILSIICCKMIWRCGAEWECVSLPSRGKHGKRDLAHQPTGTYRLSRDRSSSHSGVWDETLASKNFWSFSRRDWVQLAIYACFVICFMMINSHNPFSFGPFPSGYPAIDDSWFYRLAKKF